MKKLVKPQGLPTTQELLDMEILLDQPLLLIVQEAIPITIKTQTTVNSIVNKVAVPALLTMTFA